MQFSQHGTLLAFIDFLVSNHIEWANNKRLISMLYYEIPQKKKITKGKIFILSADAKCE